MASDRVRGDKGSKIVVLDSSALLTFFEFSVRVEDELTRLLGLYHVVVPIAVVRELEVLAQVASGKKKIKAIAALNLVVDYEVVPTTSDMDADEAVIDVALKTKGIVFTNDKELRKIAKTKKLPMIFLRGKKKLVLDE
jgi:rRNA-processing protein FCF1